MFFPFKSLILHETKTNMHKQHTKQKLKKKQKNVKAQKTLKI